MDLVIKKAVEDAAKRQVEVTERLIEQQEVTNRWLAHLCSLLEAQDAARV
jgi:hypothetical protein